MEYTPETREQLMDRLSRHCEGMDNDPYYLSDKACLNEIIVSVKRLVELYEKE